VRTLAGEPVDRLPLGGEGIREDVREEWVAQGCPAERDLDAEFEVETWETVQPNLAHPRFWLCGARDVDESTKLPPNDSRRYPEDWTEQVERSRSRTFALGLNMSRGLLLTLGVEDWRTLAPVLLALGSDSGSVARTMSDAADFAIDVLERAFDEVEFDYAIFREPIASNDGPVVGPWSFEDACGPAYRTLTEYARMKGIRSIVFQSYGNATPLLHEAIRMGFNVYWGGEVGLSGTDYHALRQRFGRELGLIGGIDASILDERTSEMESRLEGFLTPLVRCGRYLPLLDGRVRPGVGFDSYVAYRKALAKVVARIARR